MSYVSEEQRAVERAAVYAAEDSVIESGVIDDDDLIIAPDEVAGWCSEVAHAAGWAAPGPGCEQPTFVVVLALPDDAPDWHLDAEGEPVAGWVDRGGAIHLDPRIVDRWKVVHELAHALDDRDGHGAGFRDRLVELVRVAFGDGVAFDLGQAFEAFGVGQ